MAEFTVDSGLRPEDMLLHDVHQAMTDADRLFQDSCEGLLDDQLVYHADYLREHMPMWESAASTLSFDKASDFYHAGRILGEMQSTYAVANMYPEFLSEKDRNTYQELHQFVLNGNDVLSLDGVVSPDGFSSDTASGWQRISCSVNAGMVEGVLSTAKRNYEYGYEHALDIDIDDRYIYRNEFARSASLVDRANEMVSEALKNGTLFADVRSKDQFSNDVQETMAMLKTVSSNSFFLEHLPRVSGLVTDSGRLEERQAYDIKLSKGEETMRTKKTATKAKTAEVQKTADELFRDKVYVQDVNTQVDALMKDVFGKSISESNIDGTYRMKSDFDAKSDLDVHMQELQEFVNTCEFTKLSDFESAGRMYGHVIGDIRIAANHFPDFAEDMECGEVVHCALCNDMLGGKPAFYELLNDKNGREEMDQAFQTGVIAGKLQSMFNCYSGLSDNDTYNTLFNDMSQLHKGMESVAESNRMDDYLMRTQACSGRPLSHPEMSEGHVGLDADLTVDGTLRGTAHIEAMDRNSVKLKWLDISPVKEGSVFGRHLYETSQVYPRNVVSDYDNVRRMTTEEAQNMKTQSVLRNKPVLARYDACAQAMMQGQMAPAPEAVKPAEKSAEQPKAAEPKEASAEAPKAEAGEKKSAEQKRPSHLIRTNNGMIHSITGYPGRKAVTVGIANGENKPLIGTVYVGNNSIIPDKKTANLPDANKASFVAFSPTKMYDFVLRTKDAEGNWKNDIRKLTGRSIVEGNRAYMAERQAAKMAAREQDLQANAQAGAEGPQMG